jgi:CelD/BcsL family acetyltransferase involved in cellulose biosynthesis
MKLHVTNPLSDDRWDEFVAWHPQASAFHQRGWLEALNRTYGYKPFVLTSTPAGERLRNGLVLCHVSSWLTGNRLVSLPFADHCDPLMDDPGDYADFIKWLTEECDRQRYKYVELRPLQIAQKLSSQLQHHSYSFHELDLTPSLEQLFRGLHKDSIQRRIRRAEKAQLLYERGWSDQLMDDFYCLLSMTRRRHHLPPQPRVWFRNLFACMGDRVEIRLVRNNGTAIAAILTLKHKSCVVYKYGCSDERHHNLGGMPFLFWRLIEESKAAGPEKIDFGRSDVDNPGLIAFKDKFGTTRRTLTYYRYPESAARDSSTKWDTQAVKVLLSALPNAVLSTAGRVLYKHMG